MRTLSLSRTVEDYQNTGVEIVKANDIFRIFFLSITGNVDSAENVHSHTGNAESFKGLGQSFYLGHDLSDSRGQSKDKSDFDPITHTVK